MDYEDVDPATLEWQTVIPAVPGWVAVTIEPAEDAEDDGTHFDPIIAWAWVKIPCDGQVRDVLWGITTFAPPDYEGPAGLVDTDAGYMHESQITPAHRATWQQYSQLLRESDRPKTE